jgi:ABC-type polysaccharide/polyol phosphate transport system ATPase subunit
MMDAIRVCKVSKIFYVSEDKVDSLKCKVLRFLQRKRSTERKVIWALKDLELVVKRGETLGIIGPNAAGKSTFLRIIAGIFPPTTGKIEVNGQIAPLIELGVGFHHELTGRENIYLCASLYGLTKKEIERIYPLIVNFSELFEYMKVPLKNYSTGMTMRLGFSIAIHLNFDILLIDEVLAVGDEHFQRKCVQRIREIKREKKTILFVSHNLELIMNLCDRACLLLNGNIRSMGDPLNVVEEYKKVCDG